MKQRIEDGWKDELLSRTELTGLELMQLPAERREWVNSFPHVWAFRPCTDSVCNLLHRDNADLAAQYRKIHGRKI